MGTSPIRRQIARIYNPDLAVYSVAAHLVANCLGLSDIPETYHLSSCLAALSLNLPDPWFSKLRIPDRFANWGERTVEMLARRDRGFAYLTLTANAPPRSKDESVTDWCNSVLSASNLPGLGKLHEDALLEMDAIRKSALPGAGSEILKYQLERGREVFSRIGPVLPLSQFLETFPSLAPPDSIE